MSDPFFLQRKEKAGWFAIIGWVLMVWFISINQDGIAIPLGIAAGIMALYWVGLDASWRGLSPSNWVVLCLFTGPLGLLIYFASRPAKPAVCYQCGRILEQAGQRCPSCGYESYAGRLSSLATQLTGGVADSVVHGPVEKARDTTKHLAIALAGFVFFVYLMGRWTPIFKGPFTQMLISLSVAAYWICTAWWVYLDAKWRRMDAIPWAVLTLVTNIFGVVTYLVIRYPDPKLCPGCGSVLGVGLKTCPFCGAEAEPSCPRCQAPVKADWLYCPACAGQLPGSTSTVPPGASVHAPPTVSIRGSVVDGRTGLPITGAEVTIDSKTGSLKVATNELGRFLMSGLEPRPYVLLASCEGFRPQAKSFTPDAVKAEMVHFALYPAPEQECVSPAPESPSA